MPPEHLQLIIEAARKAPTDATAQMYSFIRITNIDLRKRMGRTGRRTDAHRQSRRIFLLSVQMFTESRECWNIVAKSLATGRESRFISPLLMRPWRRRTW